MKKIYIIDKKSNKYQYLKYFKDCEVGENILNYKQIHKDHSNKIIGIAVPPLIDWSLPSEILKKIDKVDGICTKSSWMEYIDLDYCKNKNIIVKNNVGINSQSVAEYAIFQMMNLVCKINYQFINDYKLESNEKSEHIEIMGKTAGIIGLGNIGNRIAVLCRGLGMDVIYWSRNPKIVPYKYQNLDKLLKNADFIFNCVETCKDTMGFLNKTKLSLMKKSSYFISILGGAGWGVEDDYFLIDMVKKGKLAGFSVENNHHKDFILPNDIKNYNIFIPAEIAFYTKESNKRADKAFIDNIISLI